MDKTPTNVSVADPAVYFDPHEWMHIQKIQMKIVSPNSPKFAADMLEVCCPAGNYQRRD
jgi:hypothetical protein